MQLQAKLTNRKDCYICLPRSFQKYIHQHYSSGDLCSVIQIVHLRINQTYYLGCQGGISQDHTIELNIQLAKNLKIEENDYLQIQQYPNCQQFNQITVYVQEWADYLIVQHRRDYFEGALLNNIQILFKDLIFPVYYSEAQYINFQFKDNIECISIAPNSEINILIASESIPKQREEKLTLTVLLTPTDDFESYIQIAAELYHQYKLDKLHKISYQLHYPSKIRKFDKFVKQSLKQSKPMTITTNYVIIYPNQKIENNQCSISSIYAKYLKIKDGQILTLDIKEADISKESHIRQIKRLQLLNSRIKLIFYSNQNLNLEFFIYDLIKHFQKQNTTTLISRIHLYKNATFYLRIMQSNTNIQLPDHQIQTLVIYNEKNEAKQICENEKELFLKYLHDHIQIQDLRIEIQREIQFERYQSLLKIRKIVDFSLFKQLFEEPIKQIQKQCLIVSHPNANINILKIILSDDYDIFTINLDKLNEKKANFSVENVKNFIKHIFQVVSQDVDKRLIYISGTQIIKSTDLIDFQQSHQILISNILSKLIRKCSLKYPKIKMLITVPQKEFLNSNLSFLQKSAIIFSKPKIEQRENLIKTQFKSIYIQKNCQELAQQTENLSFSEFNALKIREEFALKMNQPITEEWVNEEIGHLQTTQMRNYKKVPTFKEIGGLENQKQVILDTFDLPMRFEFLFAQTKIKLPKSVLLYGMPGCGKTYFAQAICNELKINVISVKGPELLNKYIGASESNVRDLFQRAQEQAPCIIFLDELDSIVPIRTASHSGVTDRVVNQFLCYLDGVEEGMKGVYIVAATSRPDLIDPALLRPGRIDKHIRIDYPNEQEIEEIMDIYKGPIVGINKEEVIGKLMGMSQADVVSFFKESRIHLSDKIVQIDDFKLDRKEKELKQFEFRMDSETLEQVLKNMKASLNVRQQEEYRKWYIQFEKGGNKEIKIQKQALQ